jgi:hypothetical protein
VLRTSVGQFLSCGFVVLLRKSIPQNRNLKTAAELSVRLSHEYGANPSARGMAANV